MTKKNTILIAIGAVLVAGVVLKIALPKKSKIEFDTYEVARKTLRQTVQVTGEVVSSEDVDLKFEGSGRVRAILKKVGDAAKAGEVLATLDDRNQAVGMQRALASLQSAQANLDRLQHGATAEDLRVAEVAVENAQTSLDQAKQTLIDTQASNESSLNKAYGDLDGQMESLYLKVSAAMQTMRNDVFDAAGSLKTDISSSDFNVQSQALSQYTAASTALTAMGRDIVSYRAALTRSEHDTLSAALLTESKTIRLAAQLANGLMQTSTPIGSTTQTAFDTRKSEVKTAWSDLNAAVNAAESQKFLVATTISTNTATLTAAEQSVKTKEGALASAEASLNVKKAPATSFDLSSARASVTSAQASLGEAQVAYDKTRIRAPFEGTIAQIPGRVGQTVSSADVILKLHGDNVYEIEADVPETDVAKLAAGLKAEITLDAYGDDVKFEGELSSIDTAQTVIQDVVYYKTRFRFSSGDRAVRAGMTANVTVIAQERRDVLIVPQRAVKRNGEKYVRVLKNGQENRSTVETGLFGDDGMVEITSGLSGGEQVILAARENGKILKE